MKLSVVIVSFNVKYFLELCLDSVFKALKDIAGEVIVVDNASTDGSVGFLKVQYPNVKLIENEENKGFAIANNQAIRMAKGEFVLLLNPDTIVNADTFVTCLSFMENHKKAGAMGVKMVDGSGQFLPESKRSFPSPSVAFFKLFGLAKLFPKSKKFGQYHLTYLSKNETHSVDVLSGAYMFLRKEVLEKTGLLDETFFMYGEDIDLSYRVKQVGFKNYYFPQKSIVHFKGESTKKGSLNYVKTFYQAMAKFARKHYKGNKATIFVLGLQAGIWLRALIAVTTRFLKKGGWLFVEILLLFTLLFGIKMGWSFVNPLVGAYPAISAAGNFALYIFIWLIAVWLFGGYDWPFKLRKLFTGVAVGTLVVAAVYGLLPNAFRFSRAVLILGAIGTFVILLFLRMIRHYKAYNSIVLGRETERNIAIIGNQTEGKRILSLLQKLGVPHHFFGFIAPHKKAYSDGYLGNLRQIEAISKNLNLNELIFSMKNMTTADVLECMELFHQKPLQYKFVSAYGEQVVGSHSPQFAGQYYDEKNRLTLLKPHAKRNKRIFDFGIALLALVFATILYFFQKKRTNYFKNCVNVLSGKKSWVTYCLTKNTNKLPIIKPGVFCPLSHLSGKYLSTDVKDQFNTAYALHYSAGSDLAIIFKNWQRLGL